jgi:hypothetical protein
MNKLANALKLTSEQEFNMAVYAQAAASMSNSQLEEMLLEVISQLMVQRNITRQLIKERFQ